MIKNTYFACYVALASSLLWVGIVKSSATPIPEAVAGLIAEYAQEPKAITDSKRAYRNRQPRWCGLAESSRMQPFNVEDFSFSGITIPADGAPAIRVNNVYNIPQAAGGRAHCFTHIVSTANGLAAWYTEDSNLNSATTQLLQQKQDACSQESRAIFGSVIVPDGSSAAFFPERNMLVVVDATTVKTYTTTDQAYHAIDSALNPPRAQRRSPCCTINALLFSGIIVAGAATAYAAGQSK